MKKKESKWKIFFQLIWKDKILFIVLFILVNVTVFLGSLYPYIFGLIIDSITLFAQNDKFFAGILFFCAIYTLNLSLHALLNLFWTKVQTVFFDKIRISAFRKILSYEGEELASVYTGDIIVRLDEDVEHFGYFIYTNLIYAFGEVTRIVMSFCFLWSINRIILGVMILCTVMIYIITKKYAKVIRKIRKRLFEMRGKNISWLIEMLSGIETVKSLQAERKVQRDYTEKSFMVERTNIVLIKHQYILDMLCSALGLIVQVCFIITSADLFFQGKISLGVLIATNSYVSLGKNALLSLGNKISKLHYNLESINRVVEIFQKGSEQGGNRILLQRINKITLSSVDFEFAGGKKVLSKLSWQIRSSEKIGIVGHSGMGKSTIVNLLCKVYRKTGGSIFVNSIEIDQLNTLFLRKQIGIIHQESYLLRDSIRNNLLLGMEKKISDEKIWEILDIVNLSEKIKSFSDGLDTIISSEKNVFSSGQTQRLLIARVMIKDPQIIILDEAMRAIDSEAAQVVYSFFDKLCFGRIFIVISHNRETINRLDRVAVLKDGEIIAYDSPDVLAQSCTEYRKLLGIDGVNI